MEGTRVEQVSTTKSVGVTIDDKTQLELQKLQNRAARVMTFSNYDADQLIEVLGWKNFDRQRNIQKASMVFKCLHELAPDCST